MQTPADPPPPPVILEDFNQDKDSFYMFIRSRDDYKNNQLNQSNIDNIIENIYGIKRVTARNPEYDMLISSVRNSVPSVGDDVLQASIEEAKTLLVANDIMKINILLRGEQLPLVPQRGIGRGIIGELTIKVVEILSRPVVGGKLRKTSNKKRSTARRRRSSKARKARKVNTRRR